MSAGRKVRAALFLGLVSGILWAITLPLLGAIAITVLGRWSSADLAGLFGMAALVGGVIGLAGGVLYAVMLAGMRRPEGTPGLALPHAILAGGMAGVLLHVGFTLAYSGIFGLGALFSPATLPLLMLFGGLGAVTGGGIAVVARRGKALPREESAGSLPKTRR
jgi:hypothetical protein